MNYPAKLVITRFLMKLCCPLLQTETDETLKWRSGRHFSQLHATNVASLGDNFFLLNIRTDGKWSDSIWIAHECNYHKLEIDCVTKETI